MSRRKPGFSYGELASQVKELADKRQQLIDAIKDLETKKKRHDVLIKPVLRDDSLKQSGIVIITFEEFEQVAARLKNEVLDGKLRPEREDEIPRIIYNNLAKINP